MPDQQVFFAYPSKPELRREAMVNAAETIDKVGGLRTSPWEGLYVGGTLVIDEILAAISKADAGVYEVTGLNENVLFELGYAVGAGKRVFPVLETAVTDAARLWDATRILGGIGYFPYASSSDIVGGYLKARPDLRETSFFEEYLQPALQPSGGSAIFYITSVHSDDASGALTRVVRSAATHGLRLIVADPRETAVQPLTWYSQQIYDAAIVVIHFESPRRLGAEVHNARSAFIGGLAHGMNKAALMLASEDYSAPFDYRDLLYVYRSAADCATRADYWVKRELRGVRDYLADIAREHARRELSTELRTLWLGEPVAENETATLDNYFLETQVYREVLADRTAIFVGRRGTGKTATMIQAGRELAEDRRNLVCIVTPSGYQMEALGRLLRGYQERDTRGYVIEAMWKFLIYSEIALAIAQEVAGRPAGVQPDAPEWELSQYLEGPGADLKADFDVRLERAVKKLEAAPRGDSLETERYGVVAALYREQIAAVTELLRSALGRRRRVAVLIDNLDRAWDRNADLESLAYLLLGLLTAIPDISSELGGRGHSASVTASVFIRTDIYGQLVSTALEPDKLPSHRLAWDEATRLIEVIEERYVASAGRDVRGAEIWSKFFTGDVRGVDTRDYIAQRVLPRPRDVITYCRAAIAAAVLRKSAIVEELDLLTADEEYSQFAFDALKIEDPALVGRLEDAFIEFAGGPARGQTASCAVF
jgi:hypothetical protein